MPALISVESVISSCGSSASSSVGPGRDPAYRPDRCLLINGRWARSSRTARLAAGVLSSRRNLDGRALSDRIAINAGSSATLQGCAGNASRRRSTANRAWDSARTLLADCTIPASRSIGLVPGASGRSAMNRGASDPITVNPAESSSWTAQEGRKCALRWSDPIPV